MNDAFSTHPPTTLYVDINSCFATIEQQARPQLRGKPLVVAAYQTGNGCILAASYEAKARGIQTGMHVSDAKKLCPTLVVTTPDPEKYRFVNHTLTELLRSYTPSVSVQSIDEMIVRMDKTPSLIGVTPQLVLPKMIALACEIKERIVQEIGSYITVSIGIAPNAFLAKTASNLEKPNGLQAITKENILSVLEKLTLTDFCGIKQGNASRLYAAGITTPTMMYNASAARLEQAFRSINGRQWWMWLHGYETGSLYAFHAEKQKSYGQSCALSHHVCPTDKLTMQVVYQLVAKMGFRLRADHMQAQTVMAGCTFLDGTYWQNRQKCTHPLFVTEDIVHSVRRILVHAPEKPVHTVFVGVYDVYPHVYHQLSFDMEEQKKALRTTALDELAKRYGQDVIISAMAFQPKQKLVDRIAFGKSGTHH